jgi:quercetin dioxygenase-like cupin family protein
MIRMSFRSSLLAALILAWPFTSLAAQAGSSNAQRTAHAAHMLLSPTETEWGNAPASLPPGARAAVIEGNPAQEGPFTLRLLLPDGYRVPPHSHPAIEHLTVISGRFVVGTGERGDFANAKMLPAGGFMVMPSGAVHYVRAEGETVIQLHGIGPWGITYVNPADDPRRR